MRNIILLLVLNLNFMAQDTNELINGVFIVNETKYYDSTNCNFNQLKTVNNIAAYFTYTPLQRITPNNYCNAGTVKFNDNNLNYDVLKKFYSLTEVNNISQQNWKVSGIDNIPNMNFIFNGDQPTFSIVSTLIKDTLKKSDTLFIQLDNIQNADSIMISVDDDNQLTNQNHVALLAPNYSNMYYLPANLFTSLVAGPRALITIEAIKYSYQTVFDKRFLFKNSFSFLKTDIKIIN